MGEVLHEHVPIQRCESPLHIPWTITDTGAAFQLKTILADSTKFLPEPLVAFRGGGMMQPEESGLIPSYQRFLAAEHSMAIIPVSSEKQGQLTDVMYYPTRAESVMRFDANLAAYRSHVGDYVREHWQSYPPTDAPIPEVTGVQRTQDGTYVTLNRYRPYLNDLGNGPGAVGIHELDTERIGTTDIRRLVKVLDQIHPKLGDFRSWAELRGRNIPAESLLHPDNPLTALRGQEWWMHPGASSDRLRELSEKISPIMKAQMEQIDHDFKPEEALESMIRNNLAIFPHQDGTADDPEVAKHLVVVHGTLYPGNIHRSTKNESSFTVTGGDRSHVGLAAESVDWLIAASAASPAHQDAFITEFLALHPSEIDRRGLAMHVLYRALSESSWFAAGRKLDEFRNLAQLAYDILKGNGVWKGANTPYYKR